MAVQVSYPGVYIDEFAPGAPIEGVGTATAAFLGPTQKGPFNQPTKITSWEAFLATFGADPLDGFYLWYAVRGFFENNGLVCYVTRVSNGKFDEVVLSDRNIRIVPGQPPAPDPQPTIRVRARVAGDFTARPIKVAVAGTNAVSTKLFRPTAAVATASGDVIQVTAAAVGDAAKFLPGDAITITGGGKTNTVAVLRVESNLIRLAGGLSPNVYAVADNATVRLANPKANVTDAIRVEDGANLAAGSVVVISQAAPAAGGTAVEDVGVVKSVSVERISPTLSTYRVVLKAPLLKNFDLAATQDVTVVSQEFDLTVTQALDPNLVPPDTDYTKTYSNLAMDPGHPRSFAAVVNGDPTGRVLLSSVSPPSTTLPPANRPVNIATANAVSLAGGSADNPRNLQAQDYKNALARLEAIDDVNMIAIPDRTDADVQLAMIAHCERLQDRFAILDSRRGLTLFGSGSVEEQRRSVDSKSGYAALYYPWLTVAHPSGIGQLAVPPSGHIAGVYARTDGKRGVFKAPAGEEATVNGVLGVEQSMSDIDQGQLNLQGINVIRVFRAGGRAVVWGARTTGDTNWQYVNIRRLFLFLEESIEEGIRWAVFEPNNQSLWKKLTRTITAFLTQQWRDGALFGTKPEEAFYVRIDEIINPDSERALGRLHIEIGVRPSYPAEFIVVRIGIWQGGSEISD